MNYEQIKYENKNGQDQQKLQQQISECIKFVQAQGGGDYFQNHGKLIKGKSVFVDGASQV